MEDFCWKSRLVAWRNTTNVLATVTYASVVPRETVHMGLIMASLNVFKVMAADIMNAYITAHNMEKYGHYLVPSIVGQKPKCNSSESLVWTEVCWALSSHLADCVRHLKYKYNKANQGKWIKVCMQETTNGSKKYYSYIY